MRRALIILLLSGATFLDAAITLDGATQSINCAESANCATTMTFAANASHAVIGIGFYSTVGSDVVSVTIGGVLTCQKQFANDGSHQATAALLLCPLSFTGSQTVTVALNTGPPGGWGMFVQSIIGAPATSFTDGTGVNAYLPGASNGNTATMTTLTNNSWVFSVAVAAGAATGHGVGASQTQLGTVVTNSSSSTIFSHTPNKTPAGSVTHSYSWTGSGAYSAEALWAIKESAGGGSTVRRSVKIQ
jgi:hypothetical protein